MALVLMNYKKILIIKIELQKTVYSGFFEKKEQNLQNLSAKDVALGKTLFPSLYLVYVPSILASRALIPENAFPNSFKNRRDI